MTSTLLGIPSRLIALHQHVEHMLVWCLQQSTENVLCPAGFCSCSTVPRRGVWETCSGDLLPGFLPDRHKHVCALPSHVIITLLVTGSLVSMAQCGKWNHFVCSQP